MLADINGDAAVDQARALCAEGHDAEGMTLDITDTPALQTAMETVQQRFGRLDSVFANAGISGGPGPAAGEAGRLVNVDLAAFERVLRVNLTCTFATVQAAVAAMASQRGGRIVVTASATGLRAEPMVSYAYSLSKAAIVQLVRQAAAELAEHRILISAIAPGPVRTNIGGGAMLRNPVIAERLAAPIPLKRIAEVDEIVGAALLLASPAASYMTGTSSPSTLAGWLEVQFSRSRPCADVRSSSGPIGTMPVGLMSSCVR